MFELISFIIGQMFTVFGPVSGVALPWMTGARKVGTV